MEKLTKKIEGHLLDLIETGTYDAPWPEILWLIPGILNLID
ncbi:MAG TPA: hypothetical protein VMW23_05985 [Sedimentisphaerales bacterium]|nr:hypothetical protein [Sedimentisphaerales bacterium]